MGDDGGGQLVDVGRIEPTAGIEEIWPQPRRWPARGFDGIGARLVERTGLPGRRGARVAERLARKPGLVNATKRGQVLADQRGHRFGQAGRQQRREAAAQLACPRGISRLEASAMKERPLDDVLVAVRRREFTGGRPKAFEPAVPAG